MNEIFSSVMRVAHATGRPVSLFARMPTPRRKGGGGEGEEEEDQDRRGDRGRAFMPLGIQVSPFLLFLRR